MYNFQMGFEIVKMLLQSWMFFKSWVDEAQVSRSLGLGFFFGAVLYLMPNGLEITIIMAAGMPFINLSFSFATCGTLEILQETVFTMVLAYFYYAVCLKNLPAQPLYAPFAVFIHGIFDWIHHFRLAPSSSHVEKWYEQYPLICGCFDLGAAVTQTCLILMFA